MIALFIHEDAVSYVVDQYNRIWYIDTFYDEDGVECDEQDAVIATVICREEGWGTARLRLMSQPTVQ